MKDSLPRRRKLGDPFASPTKIAKLLDRFLVKLKPALQHYFNVEAARAQNYEPVVQLLQRASNYLRTGESAVTRAGKRFPSELLSRVIEEMSALLARESQNRISFRTFTDNNLRVLDCPADIKTWLEDSYITLFEALQLKRLNSDNLNLTPAQSTALRKEFLTRCREERWIAHRLRREIDLRLGRTTVNPPPVEKIPITSETVSEALSSLPANPASLFSEQLYLMMEILQTIDPSRVTGAELERLLTSVDEVLLQLQQINRKQSRQPAGNKQRHNLGFG